jgi:fluoroquinolone resistance protein
MDQLSYEDETFNKLIYTEKIINGREFQDCTFRNCDLSNSSFSRNKFLNCTFEQCNLSMLTLDGSTLNDAVFKGCKILAVNFSKYSDFLFSVGFENCILDYASFMSKKMPKTTFSKCSLKEVSFSQANLAGSIFKDTDLAGAVFNRTDLSAANFVTAHNFDIDPEINNLKKSIFALNSLEGLLTRHQIKIV